MESAAHEEHWGASMDRCVLWAGDEPPHAEESCSFLQGVTEGMLMDIAHMFCNDGAVK